MTFAAAEVRAFGARSPGLSDPGLERERRDLIDLGENIVAQVPTAWPRFQPWLGAVHGLTDGACRTFSAEAALAALASELRRLWLTTAHESSDPHQKSPHRDDLTITPSGVEIDFGYERDIRPLVLERRCFAYAPAPAGWASDHAIFSSAQSALTAILIWAQKKGFWSGRGDRAATLLGGYFETQDLLDLFARDGLTWRTAVEPTALTIVEPVFFGERRTGVFDIAAFHAAWRGADASEPALLVLDTTLTGPLFPVHELLKGLSGPAAPLVIRVHSGLKLDQAGLEIANAGIVSVYSNDGADDAAPDLAAALRKLRTIVGAGLSFDEIAALEAPWFLDAQYFARYSEMVFANNAALALALANRRGLLFDRILHPALDHGACAWAKAPYVVLRLPEGRCEHYHALERIIAHEAAARGLHLDIGGSFGFRGHRFEAVVPDQRRGAPFLRVAMGGRAGPSVEGVIALMRDIATFENLAQLAQHYPEGLRLAPHSRAAE